MESTKTTKNGKLSPSSMTLAIAVVLSAFHFGCQKPIPGNQSLPPAKPTATIETVTRAEGGWESSGGSGVACFANKEHAEQARADLAKQKFLGPQSRTRIQSIQTLDSWDFVDEKATGDIFYLRDYLKTKSFAIDPSIHALRDPEAMEKWAIDNWRRFAPLFALQLDLVTERLPLSSWEKSTSIQQVEDRKPARPILPECVLIQLAVRLTQSNKGLVPATKIIYDHELVRKMSVIDQALLKTHEDFYLIGREGNHFNSDEIRKFVVFSFSKQALGFPGHMTLMVRQMIGYPFGDYMRFFMSMPELSEQEIVPGTAYERYRALISLMVKMREQATLCLERKGYSTAKGDEAAKIQRSCQNKLADLMKPISDRLTPAEAFVFIARFHLDQRNGRSNSEFLSIWDRRNPSIRKRTDHELAENYCSEMKKSPAKFFLPLQDKAYEYCRTALGLDVKPIGTIPIQTYFSCFSPKHTIVWHDHQDANQGVLFGHNLDRQNGRLMDATFNGEIQLLKTEMGPIEQDYGYGNRSYAGGRVYRFTARGDGDQVRLRAYMKLEPETVVDVVYEDTTKTVIKSMDINLNDCKITETNLPESVFNFE